MKHKNYSTNDKVKFHDCGELSEKTGVILGRAMELPEGSFYIVMLDNPLQDRLAVVITEHCIDHCYMQNPHEHQ
jgi:hypothetical protein